MYVFVAATAIEAKLLIEKLLIPSHFTWKRLGNCLWHIDKDRPTPIVFIVTGMGPMAAQKGLESALDFWEDVKYVVGYGFAGGLIKTAQKGDLVIPEKVLNEKNMFSPNRDLYSSFASFAAIKMWPNLISVKRIVSSKAQKAALYAATDAHAVDMESAAWANECDKRKIPWVIVRSILDCADEALPEELQYTVDYFGRIRWSCAVSQILFHPSSWKSALALSIKNLRKVMSLQTDIIWAWLQMEEEQHRKQSHAPTIVRKITETA